MKGIHVIITFFLVVGCNYTTQAQNLDKKKLDQYFQTLYDNNKFMGNVSIFHEDSEIYSKSVGYTDIETQILNTDSTKSCVGSISKTLTAVMIFQAIESGNLSLNQTIDKYFPSIKNAEKITIEHLLSHRSGIGNLSPGLEFMTWSAKTKEQMIEIITAQGSDFEPNTTADYSNSNYVLLSYILESIYGKSYAEILRDNISIPLSLENTYFGRKSIDINNYESNSYIYSDKWNIQTVTEPSVTLGAGAIVSTPKDLNKFADALFKGILISEKNLSYMLAIRDDYGMGIFSVPYFSKQGYGHRGGVDGFNSMLIYLPEDKISYAITSNGLNCNFTEIHATVLNSIYGQQFDIPIFEGLTIDSGVLDNYVGVYMSNQLPLEITISKENNSLLAQATGEPTFFLKTMSEHVFKFDKNDVTLMFSSENATMILIQGEAVFYFEKE